MRIVALAMVAWLLSCASDSATVIAAPPPAIEPAPAPADEPPPRTDPSVDPMAEPAPVEPAVAVTDKQLARARAVQRHVAAAAAAYGVDPNLINAIAFVESKFDAKAKNRSGARGLMQLMPVTSKAMAKALGRAHRPDDAEFSIHAGAYLLSRLLAKLGDEELALFGYARGSGAVRRWQQDGGPMPEGVRTFIAKVQRARSTFAALGFPESALRRDKGVARHRQGKASAT